MALYELGNCLRGFFSGEYDNHDKAWDSLANRFSRSFPSTSGRYVEMTVLEQNKYGYDQKITCRTGYISPIDIGKAV